MRNVLVSVSVVSLCSALICAPAFAEAAEDGPTDRAGEIVVYGRAPGYVLHETDSATKTPTPLIDVPQAISVLNRKQIEDQAVEGLGEALRYVPGVVLGQGEGHRDQVTLRGQNSTADFYADGLRDDAQYYRPLYNTERVEVLKGANAMIFGRGGGGGVINRVSKVPRMGESRHIASAAMDIFGAWTVTADLAEPLGENVALRLNAAHEHFASHRDRFDGRFTGIAPTLAASLGERTRLILAYEYADDARVTDRGVPSLNGSPLTGFRDTFFGDATLNRSTTRAHIGRARLEHELADNLTLDLTGQYASHDKYYGNIYPRSATATSVTLEGYASETARDNAVVQGNLVWRGQLGGTTHTLLAGFEVIGQTTNASRRDASFGALGARATVPLAQVLTMPVASFGPINRASHSYVTTRSLYVQDQIELGEHLQIVAGARRDWFRIRSTNQINGFAASRSDGKWSPRFGLIAKPQENLSFYASYALSFLPQSGDQFTVLDAVTATLAPEKFRNVEAGMKWDITPELGLTAAVYRLDRSNTRATDPLNGQPVLTGRSRSEGFEVSLAGRITPQWQAAIGYANQRGKVLSATTAAPAGRRLAQLPRHQFSVFTRYDATDRIGFGLGVLRQSSQFTTISNLVRLPGFTRVDAAVYFDVSDRFALQLNAENLTGERYFPSAHTDNNISTGKPFNVKATARVKF